jgi:CDP-glucose 4,6-dehydratase
MLAERLFDDPSRFAGAWNFGPSDADDGVPVVDVARTFVEILGRGTLDVQPRDSNAPHEARLLRVDSSKARTELDWRPRLGTRLGLEWTAPWYRDVRFQKSIAPAEAVNAQIAAFEEREPRTPK